MEELIEVENTGKSASVLCVQYLLSQHMKGKRFIKKDELLKTVFKGRITGKNYDRVVEDVSNTLRNVFGLSISHVDNKSFMIVNNIGEIPGISYSAFKLSKYRVLLQPIIAALVMQRSPISEGQMWNILEQFSHKLNLDIDCIKDVVKGDFVKEQYLQFKPTDDTTVMLDPDKTSYWFSLGPRALVECDQMMVLLSVAELYNVPVKSFKRVYAVLNK